LGVVSLSVRFSPSATANITGQQFSKLKVGKGAQASSVVPRFQSFPAKKKSELYSPKPS
jgi:hypothetical protein